MDVTANNFDRLWTQCQDDVMAAVRDVGESGWYILGTACSSFEANLAASCGSGHAIGCGNGMDAIEIALRALEIGPGAKVLTTPLSAFATTLAILRAGAEPIFCDVDEHGLIDPIAVETALAAHGDIRCVIPVHLYGHLADMPTLAGLVGSTGVVLIEDAAQAIGACRGEVRVGASGRTACFSFYPTKNLGAFGDGGALITGDPQIGSRARTLRNYGQAERYVHVALGLNSRLDELQAAILGRALLPRLADWTALRRAIASRYLEEIGHPGVRLLPGPDPTGSVWHLFPVLVEPDRRDAFLAFLTSNGVQPGLHYPVLIPHQKAMATRGTPPLVVGDLSRALRFAEGEVSLPINPFLTEDEVGHVIATVNAWPG